MIQMQSMLEIADNSGGTACHVYQSVRWISTQICEYR